MAAKDTKGLTSTKEEDFSEWFTQLIQKAELIEYSPVSGCYILRPASYFIWECVQQYFDPKLKEDGVKNAYFPLFIPESLLSKEKAHVEGFAPEVAWVETGGKSKLAERLAVRPTSETIICESFAKWVRSHRDLPMRINQWCNVVRWEFKHCTPFLRSREFLWQEGHTIFASKKEAVDETHKILEMYGALFKDLYALPVLKGKKSEGEKFAGAEYTLSVEAFLPNGKAIQGATSHHLGQNFAKAFNINFLNENQTKEFVFQNSWGISTRSIGVMILMHSDDKGLILPPPVAHTQVVIVPILFDTTKEMVLKQSQRIAQSLMKNGIRVHIDSREEYSPGWKFNEWEMKGIPLRLEIGPKDLAKHQVVLGRRDTGEKKIVPLADVAKKVPEELLNIHQNLYNRAEQLLHSRLARVSNMQEASMNLEESKLLFAPWCGEVKCEETFKEKTGAKSLNSPFEQAEIKKDQKCFACNNSAKSWFYFGRSY